MYLNSLRERTQMCDREKTRLAVASYQGNLYMIPRVGSQVSLLY